MLVLPASVMLIKQLEHVKIFLYVYAYNFFWQKEEIRIFMIWFQNKILLFKKEFEAFINVLNSCLN